MKKIFLIFAMLFSLATFSQNQIFNGVKTFTSPPKFKNLIRNDANTKILSINGSNLLQWVDKSTISGPVPNLQAVTGAGSTTTDDIEINDAVIFLKHANISNEERTIIEPGAIRLMTISVQDQAVLRADNVTDEKIFQFPNTAGTLVTDAPSDGNKYVRRNNSWVNDSNAEIPTLQQVVDQGNGISTNITLSNGNYYTTIYPQSICFDNMDGTNRLACLDSYNGLQLRGLGGGLGKIHANNIPSTSNISFELPSKPSGNYTIATEDINKLNLSNIPQYNNNSSALSNGLNPGDIYRTSTGQLMITF